MPAKGKRKANKPNNKRKNKLQRKVASNEEDVEVSEDPSDQCEEPEPVGEEESESEQEEAEGAPDADNTLEITMKNEEAPTSSSKKLPMFHRPQPGENLILNRKAYDMRHLLKVNWPCMSFDVVMDNEGLNRTKYPLSCTIVAGSQAEDPRKCDVMMKKIQHLCRTKFDKGDSESSSDEDEEDEDEDDAEEEEEDDDEDPIINTRDIPHKGSVNRIRAMRQHPGIVACWNEEGFVEVYDMREELQQLCDPKTWNTESEEKGPASQKVKKTAFFQSTKAQHGDEGFALQWNPRAPGLLASGDLQGKMNVWQADAQGTSFAATRLEGHAKSVEDAQWSPSQENVLASCSVDGTVRLWDIRDAQGPEKLKWQADVVDVNVISWNDNAEARQFLASGSDSGVFKVWDLRMVKRSEVTPIFESDFHRQSITSIEWSPVNSFLLAVASQDMVTFWDFSVERDEEAADNASPEDDKIPPQVMFIHQGVHDLKEVHWHPQVPGLMITTDLDGFQFFKPTNWKSLIK